MKAGFRNECHARMSESTALKTCPAAKRCGACQSIHVPYADQLAAKDAFVRELFSDLVSVQAIDGSDIIKPILGMDDPYHYRNKVASPFAPAPRSRILQKGRGTKAKGTRSARTKGDSSASANAACTSSAASSSSSTVSSA